MKVTKYVIAIMLLLNAATTMATIYVHLDKNGNPVYSDTPKTDTTLKVENLNNETATFTQAPSSAAPASSKTAPNTLPQYSQPTASINNQEKQPYHSLIIQTPTDQATIQNQPTVNVEVKVDPELQTGDQVQMYLDGTSFGLPSQATKLSLPRIERGTHQLYATIIDINKTIIKKSPSITIYVHQTSVLNPPANH